MWLRRMPPTVMERRVALRTDVTEEFYASVITATRMDGHIIENKAHTLILLSIRRAIVNYEY
jgi:hypothetical protein